MAFGSVQGGTAIQRARMQTWLYYGRKERRLKQAIAALTPWTASTSKTAGDYVVSYAKQYQAQNTANTGTVPPSHEGGIASDGGVTWLFIAA